MTRGIIQSFSKSLCAMCFICAVLLSFASYPVFAQNLDTGSETSFEENYAALKKDSSLQFELAPPKERAERKDRNRTRSAGWRKFSSATSNFIQFLFYGICAALVATVLFFIIREFIHIRFPEKTAKVEEEPEEIPLYIPDAGEAQLLLGDVDKLAGEGKFAEAIHTLLFRSIQDIEDKRPHSIRQSFTSREIAELKVLSPEARTAFSQIGRVVEEGFFGSRALGKSEFEACRDSYLQFTRPKAWS